MKTANVKKLPLLDLWYDSDNKKRWKANLPFTPKFPLWSGIQTEQSSVVYFELEPGCKLGEHYESSEEILFVISGDVDVVVGDERFEVSDGELLVIPPSTPHFVQNKGEQVAKFLGFFADSESYSTFSEDVSPVGSKVL
ncbi:cupin domain-containing protein [Neobacillus rhizophilus]|uniref:Cupin domain-containing protein n=1 Tax=Neobacillus rhizophilus TaxID=2833579 RepID=A0A942U4W2_9BACI|nr:cupin domain-containing protein [Neobacillus rhizophilus]MBS4214750.1 cupin domain-containing protein [Neobacillus rhizophilus]